MGCTLPSLLMPCLLFMLWLCISWRSVSHRSAVCVVPPLPHCSFPAIGRTQSVRARCTLSSIQTAVTVHPARMVVASVDLPRNAVTRLVSHPLAANRMVASVSVRKRTNLLDCSLRAGCEMMFESDVMQCSESNRLCTLYCSSLLSKQCNEHVPLAQHKRETRSAAALHVISVAGLPLHSTVHSTNTRTDVERSERDKQAHAARESMQWQPAVSAVCCC